MTRFIRKIKTPIGTLTLIACETKLRFVYWHGQPVEKEAKVEYVAPKTHGVLDKAEKQLIQYFLGERQKFELPLAFDGTEFQQKVWSSLQTIPFGLTNSYVDIAKKVNSPKACRAVGAANGRNPIPIIVPCHRVIGKDGSLTGFGGGLKIKEFLLRHEGIEKLTP